MIRVDESPTTLPNNSTGGVSTASCPSGTRAVGGGYEATGSNVLVFRSFPTAGGAGWQINARATSSSTVTLTAYAICADATQ